MKFSKGETIGFPDTAQGRARARELAATFPDAVQPDPQKPRRVRILKPFVLRPAKAAQPSA